MRLRVPAVVFALLLPASAFAAAPQALFDNTHAETAGNADWVIDNDQPVPFPAPSGIGPTTAGTYWTGAISSWGVDLVKRGYGVATLTSSYGISYGNAGNPYDLSHYDVFIVDEPNTRFSSAEAAAILAFVRDGGGLVAVADHYASDRNSDGWDSPMIWNDLDPGHLLGVHCAVSGEANNNIVQTSANVNASAADSVTRGPIGNVVALAFHNGTTMTLDPAANPTVRGEVWMTGVAQSSLSGVMAASSVYGNGRVVFVGDSSPCDDGSANAGNSSIYDGWGESPATDSTLFLNATLWVTRRAAPVICTLTVTTSGAGAVTRNPDQPGYPYGTSVQLTAVPASGWAFTGWSGDLTGNANPVSVTLDGDRSVSAGFADVTAPTVALASPDGGEAWTIGSVHAIVWSASDNAGVDSVNVDWSASGVVGPWSPIAHGLANSGSCDWTVPAQAADSARVRVTAFDPALNAGAAISDSAFRIVDPNAAVGGGPPTTLRLEVPRPNPGRGAITLRFSLPAAGAVSLEILDCAGRQVWRSARTLGAGPHAWSWDGRTSAGNTAGAGLYFARLVTPWGARTQRLAWLT